MTWRFEMKKFALLCVLALLIGLSGCAGGKAPVVYHQKQAPKAQSVAERSKLTKAAMYSYAVKGAPVGADTFLISDTEASNATRNATISSLGPAIGIGTAGYLDHGTDIGDVMRFVDAGSCSDTQYLNSTDCTAATETWTPALGLPVTYNIANLAGVSITGTPTTDYVLKFNGTNWSPAADATAAGAGYVSTPPTYSDETCTAGQYARAAGYRFDCLADGTGWDRTATTTWSNPTPVTWSLTFTQPTNGVVTSSTLGLNCGTGQTDCTITGIADNTAVTDLLATADSGYEFTSWGGDVTGAYNAGSVTFDANKAATCTFSSVSSWAMTDDFAANTAANYTNVLNAQTLLVASGYASTAQYGAIAGYYHTATSLEADQVVQSEVFSGHTTSDQAGMIYRVTPGGTPTGYTARVFESTRAVIGRFSGTTHTFIAYVDYTGGKTWPIDTAHIMQVSIVGNSIDVAIDWNDDGDFLDTNEDDMTAVTDSTYATGNYAGIYLDTAAGTPLSHVDNLKMRSN